MFTGIVQGTCEVVELERKPDFLRFTVAFAPALLDGLATGASVAIDGICQTVARIDGNRIGFDAMAETLAKTTLADLRQGERVNVERSLRAGQEVGGHEVSGHVDGTLDLIGVEQDGDNCVLTLRYPGAYGDYIFDKGFLGVHGASLTVCNLDRAAATFQVYLIPETLRLTNLSERQAGDRLNFEIDRRTQTIVDTVKAFLQERYAGADPQGAG